MQVLLTLFILPIPNKFEKKFMKLFKKYFGILIHKTENKYCGNKKVLISSNLANQGKVSCMPTIQGTFNLLHLGLIIMIKYGPNFKRKMNTWCLKMICFPSETLIRKRKFLRPFLAPIQIASDFEKPSKN